MTNHLRPAPRRSSAPRHASQLRAPQRISPQPDASHCSASHRDAPYPRDYVPAALAKAEALIGRAFTGNYGPHQPKPVRPEYQGVRYFHPLLGEMTCEAICRQAQAERDAAQLQQGEAA